MSDTDKITQFALWKPAWFELDQSLEQGKRGRFCFFTEIPDDPTSSRYPQKFDFMFFNQVETSKVEREYRDATIVGIEHLELGPISEIDCKGLDYMFYPMSGSPVGVNAEETPGSTTSEWEVEDWAVLVMLEDVSDPVEVKVAKGTEDSDDKKDVTEES